MYICYSDVYSEEKFWTRKFFFSCFYECGTNIFIFLGIRNSCYYLQWLKGSKCFILFTLLKFKPFCIFKIRRRMLPTSSIFWWALIKRKTLHNCHINMFFRYILNGCLKLYRLVPIMFELLSELKWYTS